MLPTSQNYNRLYQLGVCLAASNKKNGLWWLQQMRVFFSHIRTSWGGQSRACNSLRPLGIDPKCQLCHRAKALLELILPLHGSLPSNLLPALGFWAQLRTQRLSWRYLTREWFKPSLPGEAKKRLVFTCSRKWFATLSVPWFHGTVRCLR